MVHEIIPFGSVIKVTRSVFSLANEVDGASENVIFRRADLTVVQNSLETLNTTFQREQGSLDNVTQRRLLNTLQKPVENWGAVAKKMKVFLEQFEGREARGQNRRPAMIWRWHKTEIEDLRRKSEECKSSLLIAISTAAAYVSSVHFSRMHRELCSIQAQLQANQEESRRWMQQLNSTINEKHEASMDNHNEARSWANAANRTRNEQHSQATSATREVGGKVDQLSTGAVVTASITLLLMGTWWYLSHGSVEAKHAEAKGWIRASDQSRTANHDETRKWMQDAQQARMQNHNAAIKATKDVGQKIDDLVTGLIVTVATIVLIAAATATWRYFEEIKTMSLNLAHNLQAALEKQTGAAPLQYLKDLNLEIKKMFNSTLESLGLRPTTTTITKTKPQLKPKPTFTSAISPTSPAPGASAATNTPSPSLVRPNYQIRKHHFDEPALSGWLGGRRQGSMTDVMAQLKDRLGET